MFEQLKFHKNYSTADHCTTLYYFTMFIEWKTTIKITNDNKHRKSNEIILNILLSFKFCGVQYKHLEMHLSFEIMESAIRVQTLMELFAFHIALISLWKVWIQLFLDSPTS